MPGDNTQQNLPREPQEKGLQEAGAGCTDAVLEVEPELARHIRVVTEAAKGASARLVTHAFTNSPLHWRMELLDAQALEKHGATARRHSHGPDPQSMSLNALGPLVILTLPSAVGTPPAKGTHHVLGVATPRSTPATPMYH